MKFSKQLFAFACVAVAAAAVVSARSVDSVRTPVPAAIESPSENLAAVMRRLQAAAEGDDYATFKTTFAEARRTVDAYPSGTERSTASDALKVFADIARLWDYAMTSPTGAFFDSTTEGGSLLATAKQYPDFGRAIADETLTPGGRTLYPTRETRRFLARQSARHLSRLGETAPAIVATSVHPRPVRVVPPERKKTPQESTPAQSSSATAAPTTTTTASSTADADIDTATPAPQQNSNMHLLLAVALILVGIGVLIVLFRASD